MARKLPSGSKLGLAFKCLGSAILPIVKDEAGPKAEDGKILHAVLEKFYKEGQKIDGMAPGDADLCSRVSNTIGSFARVSAECGLYCNAVDRDAGGYVLEHNGDVDAAIPSRGSLGIHDTAGSSNGILASHGSPSVSREPVGGGEPDQRRDVRFVAVADFVGHRGGADYAVYDWKSSSWVQDPEFNWQLLLPAISTYLIAGCPSDFRCTIGIVYVGQPPDDSWKQSDSVRGDVCRSSLSSVGAAECERLLGSLARLQLQIMQGDSGIVTLYEGKHCQYCPARHRCPAKVGALAEAVATTLKMVYGEDATDEAIVSASRVLFDSQPQLKKAEITILKEHGGELDLGDGRIAVLTVDGRGREKVYTKKSNAKYKGTSAGSDASETSEHGTKS